MKELVKWLKRPGNSQAKMAAILGYKTSTTIANWLTRGAIPEREKARVRDIVRGAKNAATSRKH